MQSEDNGQDNINDVLMFDELIIGSPPSRS